MRRFGFKVRAEGSSGFRAIICLRSFGFGLSGESFSGFKVKVEKARAQGFACRFFMFKGKGGISSFIDPVVHNKYKKQSINHNNIKCLYNQLNAHAHFVFTAQPSVLGKARACQCTLRRDNVSLYLALGVLALAPRVQ